MSNDPMLHSNPIFAAEKLSATRFESAMAIARWVLLALLAGLLIGRRDFAHLNLGDIWSAALQRKPPTVLAFAFVTETTLMALSPIALWAAYARARRASGPTVLVKLFNAFGWGFWFPIALIVWGALHAIAAKFSGGDTYLIIRQSALAFYPLFFIYTLLFFGDCEKHTRFAVWGGVAAALLCAALDAFAFLDPRLDANGLASYGEWMPIYGQETLPIAILGLLYALVSTGRWTLRALAMAGVLLAGWRQGIRPMQSVVPIGMACGFALILAASFWTAARGQRSSLKRAALCFAVAVSLLGGYRVYRAWKPRTELPGTETSSEVKAWGLGQYGALFEIFDRTQAPSDPAQRMVSRRAPMDRVDDPEVYKLEAVFKATSSVSVRNNMWRFLVWRRMLGDWRDGHPIIGAGVGRPWFYRALYQSGFHFGEERDGLDPHNSYLNTLYRYGAVGLFLVLICMGVTLRGAVRALRVNEGDPLLEGLLIYFGYAIIFAFFTVSFEGPAYSMPFWMTMGLIHSRSNQILYPQPVNAQRIQSPENH